MHQYAELISSASLLKVLQPEAIQTYLSEGRFRLVSYGKNAVIHFEGELCTRLEIILDGRVVIERIDQDGGLMTIAEFAGDDILGGNQLFSRRPYYSMTITAKQPSVILEIDKELLFDLFCGNPMFLRIYLEYVSDHASILGNKLRQFASRTIRESIMNFIQHESKRQGSSTIKLQMTKKALAERIGVQRTSLSRELAKMKQEGLIMFDADSMTALYRPDN